jgi:hypothetical protein
LFSYGIFGSAFFFLFLWIIFRRAEWRHLIYFGSISLYGITHQGLRDTLLWIFLGLVFAQAVSYDPRIRRRDPAVPFDPSQNPQKLSSWRPRAGSPQRSH